MIEPHLHKAMLSTATGLRRGGMLARDAAQESLKAWGEHFAIDPADAQLFIEEADIYTTPERVAHDGTA